MCCRGCKRPTRDGHSSGPRSPRWRTCGVGRCLFLVCCRSRCCRRRWAASLAASYCRAPIPAVPVVHRVGRRQEHRPRRRRSVRPALALSSTVDAVLRTPIALCSLVGEPTLGRPTVGHFRSTPVHTRTKCPIRRNLWGEHGLPDSYPNADQRPPKWALIWDKSGGDGGI